MFFYYNEIFDTMQYDMRYENICTGKFIARPNRFIAEVEIDGRIERAHVKNTGRLREILLPGAVVYLEDHTGRMGTRKLRYSLIGVEKGDVIINMDSQAPNTAARHFLENGGLGVITGLRPETKKGNSRFDFSFTQDERTCFLEVKGVTLENDGVCAFPDAPTDRGVKHLKELTALVQEGYGAYLLFVIQMPDVRHLHPNDSTDPAFGQALRAAAQAGVQILAYDCTVTPDTMVIQNPVPVIL